jgi:hypothetical protein
MPGMYQNDDYDAAGKLIPYFLSLPRAICRQDTARNPGYKLFANLSKSAISSRRFCSDPQQHLV